MLIHFFVFQIFPIHIKGVAGSLVVLVNWLGAWAVSYTFNYMMSWSSTGEFDQQPSILTLFFIRWLQTHQDLIFFLWELFSGTFFIYATFCAMTIAFVAKIMPETKGKTLEEIQASLN